MGWTAPRTVTLVALRLGPAAPGAGIAAGRGGEAIEEGGRAERAADRFRCPERRDRLGPDRRIQKVDEAAAAAVDERRDADEAVVPAFAMRPCARPAPVLGPRDEFCPDRVQRHIARRRHQMLLVHGGRTEARLEEMARDPQPRVDDRGIAPMRLAERPSQRLLAVGDENEVDVVWHQAIGPAGDALPAALARQQIAIKLIVVIAEKHSLAPVAALRDMMGKAGDDEAGDAGHGGARRTEQAETIGRVEGLSKVSPKSPKSPDGVWKAGLDRCRFAATVRAMRLAAKQRATPHPALRAPFPSRAGEGTRAAILDVGIS